MKVHPIPPFAQMPPELDNVTLAGPLTSAHWPAGVGGDSAVSSMDTFRRGNGLLRGKCKRHIRKKRHPAFCVQFHHATLEVMLIIVTKA